MDQLFDTILDHALISVLPGILGVIIGMILDRLILQRTTSDIDESRKSKLSLLIPWYGIAATGLVVLLINPYLLIWFGLGKLSISVSILLASILMTLALGSYNIHYLIDVKSRLSQYILTLRVIIPAAVGFAILGYDYGNGGAGTLLTWGFNTLDFGLLWKGYAVIAIVAILADFIFAILYWKASSYN